MIGEFESPYSLVFTQDELHELTEDPVLTEHIDDGRWVRYERVIFCKDRKFYAVTKVSGLTEYQSLDPEDTFPDPPVEVKPVSVTTTQWQEVNG